MRDFHRSTTTWLARRTGRGSAARPPHRSHRRRLTLEPLEGRALLSLTTWTVNSLGDTGAGTGTSGDLRYVITQADQTQGDNTINFAVTGTITLNSALPDLSNTTGVMDIEGPGASSLTVARSSAAPDFGIFTVDANVQARLVGLAITGGVGNPGDNGGGINNSGTVSVINSTIEGNSDSNFALFYNGDGGGIDNEYYGTMTVTGSTIENNSAGNGGGIANSGVLTVTNSSVGGNSTYIFHGFGGNGGGIYNTGTMTVNDSTISGNSAYNGAGIDNAGTATVSNSTIANNSNGFGLFANPADIGGGIDSIGMLTVTNSTIADNSAYAGGGTYSNGTLTV